MVLFILWKKSLISLRQMNYHTSAVEMQKNQVFASVVDRVLTETQVRFRGFGSAVPQSS
jgi:hypothetical protein